MVFWLLGKLALFQELHGLYKYMKGHNSAMSDRNYGLVFSPIIQKEEQVIYTAISIWCKNNIIKCVKMLDNFVKLMRK